MKTGFKIGLGILVAAVLVVVGLSTGWLLWGRRLWAPGMMGGPGMMWGSGGGSKVSGRGSTFWGRGPGMMGRATSPRLSGEGPGVRANSMTWNCGWTSQENCPMWGGYPSSVASGTIGIEQAQEAIETYVEDLGYTGLKIDELMEFEHNFYAIVQERDTGVGAMELLVDKSTGAVGPEMGPNMMWNARYGMHGRGGMMGGLSDENLISEEEALDLAQRWLDTNRPGVTAEEHVDPFYGYYTLHTMKDGEIEGMLSVHGRTGQVWYHTWHGAFIQMIEEEEEHG
jgi:hypothetical protein